MNALLRTPLYDWHIAQSARMVEFGGWEMPIQYTSVIREHEAVRKAVGITDVSHMGRFTFDGSGACRVLDSILTRDLASLQPGQIRYSLLTTPEGGIVDDLLVGLVTRLQSDASYYSLVVNASNKEKDLRFIKQFWGSDEDIHFTDETFDRGMIAVQGPRSLELLQPFVNTNLSIMKYYSGLETTLTLGDRWAYVSRTGYTGEDGFEISVESFFMEQFVEQLFDAGQPLGVEAVGLGARDTLRLEAGMPLYGHELTEQTDPFEADLAFALYLDGPDFPGRDALRKIKDDPLQKIRIGLEMTGKRPAREGCEIYHDNRKIGFVSSGTFSPTLQKPIAMGYVFPEYSQPGQSLCVDIRGKMCDAIVVSLPFYRRKK